MAASITGRWIKIQYKPLYNRTKKCSEFGFWRIRENIQVRCVSSEGCFPYFCLFFNQLERICDLTALKRNTFFSTGIKSLLSCNSKMALLIGQTLRNGQSPVCSRCIVIGQYSVERQRTLYGVAGTETRGRRLRNTWKSCMKRNIMRNPCKLYFCFLFFFHFGAQQMLQNNYYT